MRGAIEGTFQMIRKYLRTGRQVLTDCTSYSPSYSPTLGIIPPYKTPPLRSQSLSISTSLQSSNNHPHPTNNITASKTLKYSHVTSQSIKCAPTHHITSDSYHRLIPRGVSHPHLSPPYLCADSSTLPWLSSDNERGIFQLLFNPFLVCLSNFPRCRTHLVSVGFMHAFPWNNRWKDSVWSFSGSC